MKARLTQIMIYVSGMQRSISFYRDVLGLEPITESANWSEFEAGDFHLALHSSNVEGELSGQVGVPIGRAELVFEVDDLVSACQEIAQRGGAIDGPKVMEGLNIQVAFLRDPDGLAIQLIA